MITGTSTRDQLIYTHGVAYTHAYAGDKVVICGLKKQAEYNGIACKVTGIELAGVKVKMLEPPGKSLLLKPRNLSLM